MSILIETERLQMREFTLDDVDAVYDFSTNAEVTRFTGDEGTVKTRQDAENLIRDIWLAEYEKYGYGRYALVHKGDQKVIGFYGVKFIPEFGFPDIGYRMLPEYWGRGLGAEAALAALEYAHTVLGLNRIVAEAVEENTASNKLLLGIGLRLVDTYEKYGFTINRYEWQAS